MKFLLPSSIGAVRTAARARLLSTVMEQWLKEKVEVTVAQDYQEIVDKAEKSEIDLVWAPPIICAQIDDRIQAIYKSVRDGRSSYRAAIIIRKGEATKLSDLKGSRAVWLDAYSAAGYVLPLQYIRSNGHYPENFFSDQHFVGSFETALKEVVSNKADVTSVFASDDNEANVKKTLAKMISIGHEKLHPMAFTRECPTDGLIICKGVPQQQADHLIKHIEDRPPQMLLEALNVEGFERTSPRAYSVLRHHVTNTLGR